MQKLQIEPPLVPTSVAAARLYVSPRTMIRWRELRKGPCFVRAGRRVLYRITDIDEWLDASRAEMVGEATA